MATLKKIEKSWVIIVGHEDGGQNEYRFSTKTAATAWAKRAGLRL